jgi:hypothetical protein
MAELGETGRTFPHGKLRFFLKRVVVGARFSLLYEIFRVFEELEGLLSLLYLLLEL